MNAVWIVDDDQSIRWVLEKALAREGFAVRVFGTARECLAALEDDSPQVLVSDIRMPGGSGIELLQQFRVRRPETPVIIMTAYSDLDSAVSAFQGGAFEYLPKPFDLPQAVELIRRAVDESRHESAEEEAVEVSLDMLGQAPAMQEVFRAIGRLSQSHVTVLITGESGTGKELVARALHKHSPRAGQSFVALNTAAIPRDLLESELFGHERGAFTGAQQMRRGRFEQAEGGTLFLDEIGDMPAELQTRLLRVLSDGQYYRVGGLQPLKANVRVIAATHQNLEERVRQGLFREDLFHRLNVIRLRLPPLRERVDDIPLLVRHFLQKSARELGGDPKRLTAEAMRVMKAFAWPGNVRQLENMCHWLTVMAPAQVVDVKDLPQEIKDSVAPVFVAAAPWPASADEAAAGLAGGVGVPSAGAVGMGAGAGAGGPGGSIGPGGAMGPGGSAGPGGSMGSMGPAGSVGSIGPGGSAGSAGGMGGAMGGPMGGEAAVRGSGGAGGVGVGVGVGGFTGGAGGGFGAGLGQGGGLGQGVGPGIGSGIGPGQGPGLAHGGGPAAAAVATRWSQLLEREVSALLAAQPP
ncbi:MAG: nitrogen regulation protein NR(I), partial [Burkholderiaceae bacterium]